MDGQLAVFNTARKSFGLGTSTDCQEQAAGQGCYRCLYPVPPAGLVGDTCAENGVFGPVPGVIGTLMAVEVLKLCGDFGQSIAGSLQVYDATDGTFMRVQLPPPQSTCALCGTGAIRSMAQSGAWISQHAGDANATCATQQRTRSNIPQASLDWCCTARVSALPYLVSLDTKSKRSAGCLPASGDLVCALYVRAVVCINSRLKLRICTIEWRQEECHPRPSNQKPLSSSWTCGHPRSLQYPESKVCGLLRRAC